MCTRLNFLLGERNDGTGLRGHFLFILGITLITERIKGVVAVVIGRGPYTESILVDAMSVLSQ